jgi:hypothetical protein
MDWDEALALSDEPALRRLLTKARRASASGQSPVGVTGR